MWVNSDKDNACREEESDDDLDKEYYSETKADDYLYEIPKDEVFENNDKYENYTFNIKKIKYKSKIPGKRNPKYYAITTYDKFKDKLKIIEENLIWNKKYYWKIYIIKAEYNL
jgi:hypothetical protein